MLVSAFLACVACVLLGATAFSPRRAHGLGLWLRATGPEPAFATEGAWDEEDAPTAFISNSEDNVKALRANEKTLMLYKSFRNWSSEYISAKVNSALNSDMGVLSRIADGGDGKKKTRPSRGGESGGTRAGGNPRKSSANRRFNKRPESESTAEVSIGEQEVRSGLIALLTLHELAAGPNATAAGPPGASAQSTSSWRNPESPEELARFAKEVENLGLRLSLGDEQRVQDGTMSTVSSGLRVTGAKASWKKSFRAGAAEESGDALTQGNKATDGYGAESGFDMDRLIVNDLATNLLTIVKEDLRARLAREADSSGSVSAQSLNVGDATNAGKGEHASANSALQQQLQGGLGRHRSRRASGRDKAKAKARVWPPEVELLSEYAIFESVSSMQNQHQQQQQQRDVGAVNRSFSPSASIAGSGANTATATLRPFLAASKRHTEICKVTEELFVRRETLLFRPGYCSCLRELCSSLLLWSHRVQSVNSSAQVLGAMARHRQSAPLELVLALFTPLPGPSAGPGPGREQGQGQGQRQMAERGSGPSAFSFWSSFYTVFTAMREDIATEALSLKAVFDSSEPHPSAAAVQLLKMGLLASVRVGGYRSGFGGRASANVTIAGARAGVGVEAGAAIGNSRATPRGLGATSSSGASFFPHHHHNNNSSSFNASDVYATLELCLRIPPANMAAAAAAEANAASTLRTFSPNSIASRQGSLSGLGGDSKTELASSVVRSLLQQGFVDAALTCFTLVLRSKESVNSRTVELLAFRVLSRGGAQGATDKKLALRMLDLLAQRRYLCSLGTLKLAMQRLVDELAQRAERGSVGAADDWEPIKRLLASVKALAPKTDTRPRVLVETLALQLTSLGLDFPPRIVGQDTKQASRAALNDAGWFEDVGEFHVSND